MPSPFIPNDDRQYRRGHAWSDHARPPLGRSATTLSWPETTQATTAQAVTTPAATTQTVTTQAATTQTVTTQPSATRLDGALRTATPQNGTRRRHLRGRGPVSAAEIEAKARSEWGASSRSNTGWPRMLVRSERMLDHTSFPDLRRQLQREARRVPLLRRTVVRGIDILVAAVGLAVLAPMLAIIALVIATTSSGAPVFVHWRLGRHGHPFPCLKFRSMYADADARLAEILREDEDARREWSADQKLRHDPRITTIGGWLRRSNLDELPQLVNVLLGQMSLVGPRPIVINEAPRYGRWLPTVLSVRPGLTGLWQVSGRNDTGYDTRILFDLYYVEEQSVSTDAAIIARTLAQMLRPEAHGAY